MGTAVGKVLKDITFLEMIPIALFLWDRVFKRKNCFSC
jgi:hypothetical protein